MGESSLSDLLTGEIANCLRVRYPAGVRYFSPGLASFDLILEEPWRVFSYPGSGKPTSVVRGVNLVFQRSADKDEIFRTFFGLDCVCAEHMASCSAEECS